MRKQFGKRGTFPCPAITGRRYMKGGFKSAYLGCHPKQVEEFNATMKHHGAPGVIYAPDGRCHVSSEADYTKVAKSLQENYPSTYECPD